VVIFTNPSEKNMIVKMGEHLPQVFRGETKLVGVFNPSEKYESKWKSSPNRGVKKNNI